MHRKLVLARLPGEYFLEQRVCCWERAWFLDFKSLCIYSITTKTIYQDEWGLIECIQVEAALS
ncbi:MAG: hypothetical protein AAGB46_08555 [Verrucomicrobiota bacterium]